MFLYVIIHTKGSKGDEMCRYIVEQTAYGFTKKEFNGTAPKNNKYKIFDSEKSADEWIDKMENIIGGVK